jgi:hypothetical protein
MGTALWLQYTNPGFRCHWVKQPKGVEVDGYSLMIVDLNNVGYKDDTWVLASQVT